MAQLVKTVNGLAIASVKTVNGLAIASVKTVNGLDNTAGVPPTFVRKVDGVAIPSSATGDSTIASVQCDGTDRALFVWIIRYSVVSLTNTVTFNGSEGLTLHSSSTWFDGSGTLELWKLVAPSVTTANIVITWTAGGINRSAAVAVIFCTGVNQTTPLGTIDALSSGTGTGTSASVAPATTTSDLVMDCLGYGLTAGSYTVGGGQTLQATSESATTGNESLRVSTKTAAAGTTTMSWTFGTQESVLVGVAVKGV